jgi:hypothetical protein
MNAKARRLAAGGFVVLMSSAAAVAPATTARAQYYHHQRVYAAPVAAGFIGGFATGTIVDAAAPPLFGAPYAYAPGLGCYMTQAPAYDQWGRFAGYGPIQVCN